MFSLDTKTLLHTMKPEHFFSDAGAKLLGKGSNPEIFIMNSDGTDIKKLASSSEMGFTRPVFSPNGTKIACLGTKNRITQIWVMDTDGLNKRQITSNGHHSFITWIDNEKVASVMYEDINSTTSRIVSIEIKSGKIEQLRFFEVGDLDPVWSPDGKMITFNRGGDFKGIGLWVINADGSNLKIITDDGMVPSWSPDSNWIAFSSRKISKWGAEIFIIRKDGKYEKQLTDTTPPRPDKEVDDWDPCWLTI